MAGPATVIRAPMGLGKTTLVVKAIGRAKGPVEYYAPTHALAEEVRALVQSAHTALSVRVVAGRSRPGASGKPLCAKHKLADAVAKAGGEVYSSLCEKKVERCNHYAKCPYIAQFKPADVTIYPHAYLPLERMRLEPGVPDVAIVDESFWQSCIEVVEVPIALLRAGFLDPSAAKVCQEIEHALVYGLPLYDHLKQVGISFYECDAALKSIRVSTGISPAMRGAAQRAALAQLREQSLLRQLLDTVTEECLRTRAESQGLVYDRARQVVRVHVWKHIPRFSERTFGAPGKSARVLIIDGSADKWIVNQWFPRSEFKTISAPRNARVIQCCSTRCSTTSLSPNRNTDPESRRAARRRLGQVQALVARVAQAHGKVLVVGPQEITGNRKAKVKPLISVPPNVDLAHFNAIRGIDQWKDHDAIIVIGRNEPPIEAVEEMARCIFLTSRFPLQFATRWKTRPRGYRLRRSRRGVDVVVHPDDRIQAVLEQVREAESVQAVDRLRLVHAPTKKLVIVLSNIPLDIDVDELVTWDELMEGPRLERAWNALPGVMPLQPEWLAKRFPQLWQTADAAKADVKRWRKECHFSNSISISNLTLFEHRYRPTRPLGRRARQRAWSVFLSGDANPELARPALEALLGHPVGLGPTSPQVRPVSPTINPISAASGNVSSPSIMRLAVSVTSTLTALSGA